MRRTWPKNVMELVVPLKINKRSIFFSSSIPNTTSPYFPTLLRSESASSRFPTGRCVRVKVKTELENKLETDTESQNLYTTCTNQTVILLFTNSRKKTIYKPNHHGRKKTDSRNAFSSAAFQFGRNRQRQRDGARSGAEQSDSGQWRRGAWSSGRRSEEQSCS